MNKEIKEILDRLFVYRNENNEMKYQPEDILTIEDVWLLLDCITNLQKENERLKEENKRIFSKVNDDELLISNAMNYAEAQDYKSRIDKARAKLKSMFDNGNEKTILDDLLELDSVLGEDKDDN
jgi:hypothetical protein